MGQPNTARFAAAIFVLCGATSAEGATQDQFDLVCQYQNRRTFVEDINRFKVDLGKLQMCMRACSSFDKVTLQGDILILQNYDGATLKVHTTVNRQTGEYRSVQSVGGAVSESIGTCTKEPYSGPTGEPLF